MLRRLRKKASNNPNLQQFFAAIAKVSGEPKLVERVSIKNEQPFVSPLAWAYFSAYSSIVVSSYVIAKAFENGLHDPLKLIKKDNIKKLIVTIAPEFSEFVDTWDVTVYYHLLDEIESRLFREVQNILEGKKQREEDILRSAQIVRAVNELSAEQAKSAAKIEPRA